MNETSLRIALVTGASRGIGLAIVRALADEGLQVAGVARRPTGELREAARLAVAADLATPDGPRLAVEQTIAELGGIDVLVNNVGAFAARTGGFAAVTDDEWHATFEINFFSAVRAIRAAVPTLVERRGSIVNVSSINARVPQGRVIDYAAAKAALTNLSRTLAEELGPQGVRVNTVSPGPTRTPPWETPDGFAAELARAAGLDHAEFLARFPQAAGISTGRLTEPEEVAAVVALLASGALRNANGSDFVVDGGQAKAA